MYDIEDLQTVVLTKGADLPDVLIDVEDSDGGPVDLSSGYEQFSAEFFDEDGTVALTAGAEGTTTGFRVTFTVGQLAAIAANEYLVRARAVRTADSKVRFGKCIAIVRSR